jgi:ketosteroid isomerase-like protein
MRENVEIVRELLAEFAETHRAVARLTTPDFVWDMGTFRGWPDAPTYTGPDGFDEFFAKWIDPYEDWDMNVQDLIGAEAERVVAMVTQRGRLRGADSWVELHYGMVYTLTEGLVSRIESFATQDEALEAAGLSEKTRLQENVKVVRGAYEAYNQGDLDRFLAHVHTHVVWEENHPLFGFVGLEPVYEGHEGVRRWWEATREPWTTVEAKIDEITPVGDNALVVSNTMRGKGAGSGVAVELPFFHVVEFRDGKIARRRLYPERQEALEAVGLPE